MPAGGLATPRSRARLLTTDDDVLARRMAETLDGLTGDRQVIEAQALEEGFAQAELTADSRSRPGGAAGGCDRWHFPAWWLVAARLKERYGRPARHCVGQRSGRAQAPGRSVPGVDLGAAVRAGVDAGLLVKGGGHAMAAGITIRADQAEMDRHHCCMSTAMPPPRSIARPARSGSMR